MILIVETVEIVNIVRIDDIVDEVRIVYMAG